MCAKQIFETISHVFAVNNLFLLGAVQKARKSGSPGYQKGVCAQRKWVGQAGEGDTPLHFVLSALPLLLTRQCSIPPGEHLAPPLVSNFDPLTISFSTRHLPWFSKTLLPKFVKQWMPSFRGKETDLLPFLKNNKEAREASWGGYGKEEELCYQLFCCLQTFLDWSGNLPPG